MYRSRAQPEPLSQLVVRARSGDEEAMAEILTRFRPLIRCLSRDLAAADREDLEQELYLLLLRIALVYAPSSLWRS